ncbi:AAA family ATPase [Acinetobacter courvalinii]|uniref:ATP-binding protein n=1 Tax=Acinetobacter courvalinii TaxID=280147 RepID=A0AA42ICM2_9GAMM|nr:AAA family ATPase [Acinetobacter courvalinii]MDH0562881.1 ATP-binding protein [Acinetobacter courvalinii]
MLYLKNANFCGLHSMERTTKISFDKRMTLLTGLNGSGKSTMLLGLFLALDGLNKKQDRKERELLTSRKNWGVELNLIEDNIDKKYLVNELKNIIPKFNLNANLKVILLEHQNLEYMEKIAKFFKPNNNSEFQQVFNEIQNIINKKERKEGENNFFSAYSSRDRKKENTEIFSFELTSPLKNNRDVSFVLNKFGNDIQADKDKFFGAFYQNEQFYYTSNLDGLENLDSLDVFTKNNNLDKTIFILLTEFRKKILLSKKHVEEYYAVKLFAEKERIKNFNFNDFRDFISELIGNSRFSEEVQNFINEANSFFNEIDKEMCISDDGDIYFKEKENSIFNGKVVKWYDCSKGEKNLLSLLLITFVYKDNNTIFIFDEPDLAMHIDWQEKLLNTFLKLAPNSQFIISTHSPAMIPDEVDNINFVNVTKLKKLVEGGNV